MEPEGKEKTQLLGGVEGQEGNTSRTPPHSPSTQGATPPQHTERGTLWLSRSPRFHRTSTTNSLSEKLGKNCYVLCRCFPGYEGPSERVSDDSISCVTKMDSCGF